MATALTSQDGPEPSVVPPWLSWLGGVAWRILAAIALGAVVIWLCLQMSTTVMSIVVAGIIAATFAPYVMALRHRGWGRATAAGVVTLGAGAIIAAVGVIIALAVGPRAAEIASRVQAGLARVDQLGSDLSLPREYAATVSQAVQTVEAWVEAGVASIASLVATVVTITILAGLLTFYLLADGDKAFASFVPASLGWRQGPIRDSATDAMRRVGGYLRGSAILGAVYAVTDFLFLVVVGVGVDAAASLSVLVFLANFIPYVGSVVMTIAVLLVALGSVGPQATVVLLILLVIRNVIVSNVLRPVVYGKTVNLNPAVILLALPAGAAVAGIFGLFVAIPVVAALASVSGAVVRILSEEDPAAGGSGGDEAQPGIPVWLDRLGQWSLRLVIVAALGGVAILLSGLVPLVTATATIAIVLAATFLPGEQSLERRGWGSGRAALGVTAAGWGIVAILVFVSVASLISNLPTVVDTASTGASAITGAEWVKTLASEVGSGLLASLASIVEAIAGLALTLFLSALLTYYLLRDGRKGWAALLRPLKGWARDAVGLAGERAVDVLGGYMAGTGALSAFGAITQAFIMLILGLPLVLPVALLSFVLGFIPYIGTFLATGIAFLIAVKAGTSETVIVMGVWTLVFNIVQGSFVAPVVYGKAVKLHPAIILVAIPAGGQLAGIMGMFLAVPVLGVLAASWRSLVTVLREREAATSGGAGSPAPSPPTSPAPAPASPSPEAV